MKKPQKTSTAPYDVGYGKPPKSNQFRKGRTGNPRGKRRGEENTISVFKRHVLKRVRIKDGEQTRTITLAEAIILKNFNAALQKNPAAMANIYRLAEESGEFIDRTDAAQVGKPLLVGYPMTLEEYMARHGRTLKDE
jgi:uncharacterized protein DUF5681